MLPFYCSFFFLLSLIHGRTLLNVRVCSQTNCYWMVLGQPVHHEVRVVAKVYFQFYFSTKSVALACRTLPLIRFVTPVQAKVHLTSTHSIVVVLMLRIMAHRSLQYNLSIPLYRSAQHIASFELALLMRAGFSISRFFWISKFPYFAYFLRNNFK